MLKKIKQYFRWLFQNNVLVCHDEGLAGQLVLEGKSRILWRILLNNVLSLGAITLPIVGIANKIGIKSWLLTPIFIVLMLVGFITFCIGMLALAYQPFWIHKNKISFTTEQLQTRSSVGVSKKQLPKKLSAFTLHYDFVQPGVVHVQFWVNHKKMYFVNAFLTGFANNETEIFEQLKPYMLAWELDFMDVSPHTGKSGTFIFTKEGKVPLYPESRLNELRQQTQESQLQVSETPELISKHLISQKGDEIKITERANYKRRMWWNFWLSFLLGGLIEFGLVWLLVTQATKEVEGVYVMLVTVGLLWLLFSYIFYDNASSDFCIKVNPRQILFRKKKGKEKLFAREQIEFLSLHGFISQGRYTTINTTLKLVLKPGYEGVASDKKQAGNHKFTLMITGSERPEKIDTQLVRDAAYENGMRIARLVAKPMALEIKWEGFNE